VSVGACFAPIKPSFITFLQQIGEAYDGKNNFSMIEKNDNDFPTDKADFYGTETIQETSTCQTNKAAIMCLHAFCCRYIALHPDRKNGINLIPS
jgi:hypothetical protein